MEQQQGNASGQGLHQRVAHRDGGMTMSAPAPENEVTEKRDIVMECNGLTALWTMGPRVGQ